MTTGDKFVNLCEKRLLGLTSLKDYLLDFMRAQFQELVSRTWDLDGTLGSAKVAISGSGNDEFDLDTGKTGTDGNGRFLKTAAAYETNVQFENANSIDYDVALHYAEKPNGINPNPRTAEPEYVNWEEVVGLRAEPDSVSEVSGAVHAVVDSVFEAGVSNAGRKCLIFMKVPAEGATSEGIAVEECTVQWDSSNNYIETTTSALGQTAISTTAADYWILALGPTVSRNTDLEAASEYWYIGVVTGAGAGNPPTVFDIADQRLIEKSLATLLENLVYSNINNSFTGDNDFAGDDTKSAGSFSFASGTLLSFLGSLSVGSPRILVDQDFNGYGSTPYLFARLTNNTADPNVRIYVSEWHFYIVMGAYYSGGGWYYDSGGTSAICLDFDASSGRFEFYHSSGETPPFSWDYPSAMLTTGGLTIGNASDDAIYAYDSRLHQTVIAECNYFPQFETSARLPEWTYSGLNLWSARVDTAVMYAAIRLPQGIVSTTFYVDVIVTPGSARSGTNRMKVELLRTTQNFDYPFSSGWSIIDTEYDDESASKQKITVSAQVTVDEDDAFMVRITGGNNSGTDHDSLIHIRSRVTHTRAAAIPVSY